MIKKENIPNLLTWLRIILIPMFVAFFFMPFSWVNKVVTIIFIIAAITDWFDGYLARKWHQTSQFGAFLDPVADKLMVAAAVILIVFQDSKMYQNPSWFLTSCSIVIISREITISALREWMANLGKRGVVAVSWIGKWKTATQMVGIPFLMANDIPWGLDMPLLGTIAIYLASIFSLYSAIEYSIGLIAKIQKLRKEKKRQKGIM